MRRRRNCCGWCGCCGSAGTVLISLGVGILLALVLPVSAIIFAAGMALILLGSILLR